MAELTIKKEEIKTEEFILDIKLGKHVLQDYEIGQEVASNYDQEFDEEMTIEKHELLEESIYDMGDSASPTEEGAKSYLICKKMKSDSHDDEFIANEGEKIKSVQCRVYKNYKNNFKRLDLAEQCKNKTVICNKCNYSCASKGRMTRHVRAVHDKVKPFKCSECDFSSAHKGSVTTHVRSIHTKEKPFKCNKCDYCCATKRSMILHIWAAHDKEKPFKCNKCDYCCYRKRSMILHMREVHDKENHYKCGDCDYSSDQKSSMKVHIKAVHNRKLR